MYFHPSLYRVIGQLPAIVLIIASIVIAIAGKVFAKLLVFLVGGFSLGLILYSLGGTIGGQMVQIILGILGFIVGGVLGLLLLPIAVGLALGFILFSLTLPLGLIISLIAGLIGLIIGALLSNPILAFVTAAVGGYLFYLGLLGFGVDRLLAIAGGFILFIIGLVLQLR